MINPTEEPRLTMFVVVGREQRLRGYHLSRLNAEKFAFELSLNEPKEGPFTAVPLVALRHDEEIVRKVAR